MDIKVLYIKTEELNNNPNKLIDLLEKNPILENATDMVVQKYEQYTYFIFSFNKPVNQQPVENQQDKEKLLSKINQQDKDINELDQRQQEIDRKMEELSYMLNRSGEYEPIRPKRFTYYT